MPLDLGLRILPDIVSLKGGMAFREPDKPWPGGQRHSTPVAGGVDEGSGLGRLFQSLPSILLGCR